MVKRLFIVLFIVAMAYLFLLIFPIFSPPDEMLVKIEPGMSATSVSSLLYDYGFIANRDIFLGLLFLTGSTGKIKHGTYLLRRNMNMFEIINILTKGLMYYIKVTIPEGLTAEQIAQILWGKIGINKDKFLEIVKKRKIEGYLFPDTYFLQPKMSEHEIISLFLNNFNVKTKDIFSLNKTNLSNHQVLVLASIIEKEASDKNERRLISGIFYNRLRKGWMLESCATVRYALKKFDGKLSYKDLKVKSPYNTYINYGLPPYPICNPGLDSILAALNPQNTDLMFFFADGKGTHIFSKYKDEHIKKQKALKGWKSKR